MKAVISAGNKTTAIKLARIIVSLLIVKLSSTNLISKMHHILRFFLGDCFRIILPAVWIHLRQ